MTDRLRGYLLSRKFSLEAGGGRNQATMAGHLLVVAANQVEAGRSTEQLIAALEGDDVIASPGP